MPSSSRRSPGSGREANPSPQPSGWDALLLLGVRHRSATLLAVVVVLLLLIPVALSAPAWIGYGQGSSQVAGSGSAEVANLLASEHPSQSTLFVVLPLRSSGGGFCRSVANFSTQVQAKRIAHLDSVVSVCSAGAQYIDTTYGPVGANLRSVADGFQNLSAGVFDYPARFLTAWEAAGATRASINATFNATGGAPGYDTDFRNALVNLTPLTSTPAGEVDAAIQQAAPAVFGGSRLTALLDTVGVLNASQPAVVLQAAADWISVYGGLPFAVTAQLLLAFTLPGDPGVTYVGLVGYGFLPRSIQAPFVSPNGAVGLLEVTFNVPEGYRGAGGSYPAQAATPEIRSLAADVFGPGAGVTGNGATAYDTASLTDSTGFLFGLTFLVILVAVVLTLRSAWAAVFALTFIGVGFELGYTAIVAAGLLTGPVNYVVTYILEAVILGIVTDYLVFFFYRNREELRAGCTKEEAASRAARTAGRAILISALVVAAGLGVLATLPGLVGWGIVLLVAVASIGLVAGLIFPAIASGFGRRFFLARGLEPPRHALERSPFYRSSSWAVRHPWVVLAVVVVIGVPAVTYLFVAPTSYNLSQGLPSSLPSVRAQNEIAQAFGANVLYPTYIVLSAPAQGSFQLPNGSLNPATSPILLDAARTILATSGVASGSGPFLLGNRTANATASGAVGFLLDQGRYAYYVVALTSNPFGPSAMATVSDLRAHSGWLVGGLTAGLVDQKVQNAVDYPLVELGLVILIGLVLGLAFRSVAVPLISIGGVFVSIGATFGLLTLIATYLLHQTVIYLIPLILIVILLSLGNDYTVFLLTRIVEEQRARPLREAIPRGIAFSGVVVTSLGLILAVSLGSLALQPVSFLEQLGIAFAISLVLDTFVLRIFYFPAALVTARRSPLPAATRPPDTPP